MQQRCQHGLDLDVVGASVVVFDFTVGSGVVVDAGLEDLADEVDEAHLEERSQARSGFLGSVQQATDLDEELFQLQVLAGATFESGCEGLAEGTETYRYSLAFTSSKYLTADLRRVLQCLKSD